ncbi:hypothetical protein [uncultured Gimesia sp.]|uniref:hypothetical protein n=1 Tax=uncultured Gimesia sp. TaxID=1678688 RepID=UPI0030DB8C07
MPILFRCRDEFEFLEDPVWLLLVWLLLVWLLLVWLLLDELVEFPGRIADLVLRLEDDLTDRDGLTDREGELLRAEELLREDDCPLDGVEREFPPERPLLRDVLRPADLPL